LFLAAEKKNKKAERNNKKEIEGEKETIFQLQMNPRSVSTKIATEKRH